MDELLKLAATYGPLGVMALGLAWWAVRKDQQQHEERQAEREDRDRKRLEYQAALDRALRDCAAERREERAAYLAELARQREELTKVGAAIAANVAATEANTRALERLSERRAA